MSAPAKYHAGYLFHNGLDGRRCYSTTIENVETGHAVWGEAALSLPDAMQKAARYVDSWPDCTYVGHIGERSDVP